MTEMISPQTSEVLLGAFVALLYAVAVLATGLAPLAASLGRASTSSVRGRLGLTGLAWLGFVMGQGIVGTVWLALGLLGLLHSWLVWIVLALGCVAGCIVLPLDRPITSAFSLSLRGRSWYFWVATAMALIVLLRGATALLPPENDDALRWYLPVAKAIADTHRVAAQPFTIPHSALYPLQIEMHWAALYAISNETAVTVWDYVCALSFLLGVALLSWSLSPDRRVAVLAVLVMLSTPGFFGLMGSGKVDNATAQYGMGSFLWLSLWPGLGRRAMILGGLYLGWAAASRYTNVILVPGLLVFAAVLLARSQQGPAGGEPRRRLLRSLSVDTVAAGVASTVALAPLLIKNWSLVGCPLAPVVGCQDQFWAGVFWEPRNNISVSDVLLYPFVWTFAAIPDSYGGISPLFLGFGAFLLAHRRSPVVRHPLSAGFAGLTSLTTWLIIKPLTLYTRWLLVPLGLLALPLSAAVVSVDQGLRARQSRAVWWSIRAAVFIVLGFLLFQSRGVVHGVRYVASLDTRASRYAAAPGRDVADWLNANVRAGQRVALNESLIARYFLKPDILWHSESPPELQWLWDRRGVLSPPDFWQFYAEHSFTYILLDKNRMSPSGAAWSVWPRVVDVLSALPHNVRLEVVFDGGTDTVLRIDKD